MEVTITLPRKEAKAAYASPVLQGLYQTIANLYALELATRAAHWNVTGREFFSLHPALGDQYDAMGEQMDVVAERIRALGDIVVSPDLAVLKATAAMPDVPVTSDAKVLVTHLLAMHDKSVSDLKSLVKVAGEVGDLTTQNMALGWVEAEEKMMWMLRSCVA